MKLEDQGVPDVFLLMQKKVRKILGTYQWGFNPSRYYDVPLNSKSGRSVPILSSIVVT